MKKHRFYFKEYVKKTVLTCSAVGFLFGFSACSDDDDHQDNHSKPSITVIMGNYGEGNNDYSALINKAIEKWEHNPQVDMKVHLPESPEEATKIYKEWAVSTANNGVRSLMIPANGGYVDMVANTPLDLKDNQQVLSFEMTLEKPMDKVKTFEINHTGISYLAGKMASKCEKAAIFIGSKTVLLENAARYFHEGFGYDKECEILEISDQYDGFYMPDSARRMAQQHSDAFILPLAGYSNNGVYEFLNECQPDDKVMAAGMDVDCNSLSKRIPFSYLINIDKAIDKHIQCWVDQKPWPTSALGLEDGMTSIVINPDFTEVGGVTKADFENLYQQYYQEAVAYDNK